VCGNKYRFILFYAGNSCLLKWVESEWVGAGRSAFLLVLRLLIVLVFKFRPDGLVNTVLSVGVGDAFYGKRSRGVIGD
jgi:hypothetical protein